MILQGGCSSAGVRWLGDRAANPDPGLKPMELAFISTILGSPTFAARSARKHAISYYYFGYMLVAMLARRLATGG
jgi:hypothetical protein